MNASKAMKASGRLDSRQPRAVFVLNQQKVWLRLVHVVYVGLLPLFMNDATAFPCRLTILPAKLKKVVLGKYVDCGHRTTTHPL